MIHQSKPLIIITGPTGVGKSDCAVSLAERVNGVIINGDMGQMYTPLTIGTAKPDWKFERVPHMLFDSIHDPVDSSAAAFRENTERAVREALASGKTPIVVGGSLFYLSTLFFKLHESDVSGHVSGTWDDLFRRDPERASRINRHDTYRINRALTLSKDHLPSQCQPVFAPVKRDCLVIHITRDRKELYSRIDARVHAMLHAGWMEEVSSLNSAWRSWLLKKKIIGYDTLIEALESSQTVGPDAVACIQKRTRNYAKRQLTFWRSFKERLHMASFHDILECDLTLLPVDLYLEKILDVLGARNKKIEELK